MTITSKHLRLTLILLGVFAIAFSLIYTARANPSFFIRTQSSTATTSPSYMTAGTATTTVTFDAGVNAAGNTDSAVLLWQMIASTTNSIQNVTFEYSQDGSDWYYDRYSSLSTTSPTSNLNNLVAYQWQFASTSPAMGIATSSSNFGNRITRIINVPTPTRYVRANFTVPVTSLGLASSSAVWAEFVAKRQAN